MSDIKFEAGKDDGNKWKEPELDALAHLVYMHVKADVQAFSGWVRPEVRSLIHAAPDLLVAVRKAEAIFTRANWLDTGSDPEAVALRELRAAIAKAAL